MSVLPPIVPDIDHIAGSPDAEIVIVEYGDFQCPYCGAAYPELKELQRLLGARLCMVFRHFPLTQVHPHALQAARFAQAAASVGKFWEMHDMLFEHQDALTEHDLVQYAGRLHIEEPVIRAAIDGGFDPSIERDLRGGVRAGVDGTPCLFINGTRFDGRPRAKDILHYLEEHGTSS